jgi:hypothetical protein
MRHPYRNTPLFAALVVLSSACGPAAQEQKAPPATTLAPPTTTTAVSDEARIRAALDPLAPEYRRCYPLLVALNAALSRGKGEAKAADAFNACQEPVNEKTRALMADLKKGGLGEERIKTVVTQWRNEQASDKTAAGGGGDKK